VARLARLILVSLGVALAVWLIPASIHIVDWSADGPVRVAQLAPLWQLWTALAVAALLTGIIHAAVGAPGSAEAWIAPLGLMWLWVIPYLPWLPDRAPALLALAGPLRWAVVALAAGGSIATFVGGTSLRRLPGRRTAFAFSLLIYLCFGLRSAAEVGPDADEPHYLVITQSLLRDHDLAIENNHLRGDYREYFGGELKPDFLRRGLNEVIYSIHAPGLPALLVPAYAVAGYRGAVVMLCLLGALAALAVFDLAALLTGPATAWIAWAATCLTVPFVPHSWLIFPEMPGALLVAWAALWLYAPPPSRARTWIWRGAALAFLPWLHTKFVILLAAMVAALLLRLWRTPRAAAALVAPAMVSVALWFWSFHVLFDAFDPQIPYGDFPGRYVLAANIPRGVLGLLFDQKFGLLMYAPVYLVAIAGGWMLLRRRQSRPFALALILTVVAFVASSTRMYMWWGGSSAPARFLVPILPLLSPMVAVAFDGWRSAAARWVSAWLLVASMAVALAGVVAPRQFMLFSAPHGLANMVAATEGPSPLSYLLPTFTEGATRAPLQQLAPWAAAAMLALVVVVCATRGRGRLAGFAAAAAGLVVFVISGAVLAGAPAEASQQRATTLRGRLELMRAFDSSSTRGLDYSISRRLSDRLLLARSAVRLSRADGALSADPGQLAGPFDLPPGRFAVRVGYDDGARGEGAMFSVTLGSRGRVAPAARDRVLIARGPADSTTPLEFELPVQGRVWLDASGEALAASVQQIEIVPESIVPRRSRTAVDVHAIEAVEGRPGAFVVYADADTFPENGVFWTRGTSAGKVLVASAGASTLMLTLHVGPADGTVRLSVDGQDRSVSLARDETRQLEIPVSPAARLVPIVVQAPGRFRPSDHEPGSTDRRWLGCQVRVSLR
jgi:hypothetical protein